MDELWQRYRTFWTPVLIGLGVFLIGVIVVHMFSDDPKTGAAKLKSAERRLKNKKMPDESKSKTLRQRTEELQADNAKWSERLNQTGGDQTNVVSAAAEQALRAAILRGAPEGVAKNAQRLKGLFDDDEVAAANAYRRFQKVLAKRVEELRTGDPNVAFSKLLSAVWSDLRVRANRADVEVAAEQLGFAVINSVDRATLPGRVLNLALVARVADVAIRSGVHSIGAILVPSQIMAGGAEDFLVLWPVEILVVGDMASLKQVLDLVTDPDRPIPLESTRLAHPKQRSGKALGGNVELAMRASSALVRPNVDLKLDVEEDE